MLRLVMTLPLAMAMPAVDPRAERQAMIDEINNTPGITWRAAMNPRFENEPVGASAALCGVKPATEEEMANIVQIPVDAPAPGGITSPDQIPESFDSRTAWPKCAKVIGDIRDQSNCGCCWAFGTAEAASDRMCIATDGKVLKPLSSEDMCFNSNRNGCNGGSPMAAWDFVKREGLVTGKQQKFTGTGPDPDPFAGTETCSDFSLPHCHHHGPVGKDPFPSEGAPGCPSQKSPKGPTECDAGSSLKYEDDKYTFTGSVAMMGKNETYLQTEIMTNGPVTVAFTVYSDFENYAGGVYSHVTGKPMGGHAVKMLGWGVDAGTPYWLVANSWNPYWGEKGYCASSPTFAAHRVYSIGVKPQNLLTMLLCFAVRIKRGNDECGIASSAVASGGDAKWVPPSTVL